MNKMKRLVLALAALVGSLVRGDTYYRRHALANASTPKVPDYKALHAEAIGVPKDKAEGMSDDDQVKAHKEHMKQVEALANDDEDEPMPAGPAEEVAAANEKVTELETALANEKKGHADALANARQAHASDLITTAIEQGRVKPADKTAWEEKFTGDFAKAKTELANARKGMKTTAITTGAGARNGGDDAALANEKARTIKVQALVNAKMKELDTKDYNLAFNAVAAEHADLFEAMQQPEPKK